MLSVALMAAACGKKGDLFLPEENVKQSTSQEQQSQTKKDAKKPKQLEEN